MLRRKNCPWTSTKKPRGVKKTQQLRKESRFSDDFHDEPRKGKGKGEGKGKPSDETTITPPSSHKTTKGTEQPSAEGSPRQVDESAPAQSEKRDAGDAVANAGSSPPPKGPKVCQSALPVLLRPTLLVETPANIPLSKRPIGPEMIVLGSVGGAPKVFSTCLGCSCA